MPVTMNCENRDINVRNEGYIVNVITNWPIQLL